MMKLNNFNKILKNENVQFIFTVILFTVLALLIGYFIFKKDDEPIYETPVYIIPEEKVQIMNNIPINNIDDIREKIQEMKQEMKQEMQQEIKQENIYENKIKQESVLQNNTFNQYRIVESDDEKKYSLNLDSPEYIEPETNSTLKKSFEFNSIDINSDNYLIDGELRNKDECDSYYYLEDN